MTNDKNYYMTEEIGQSGIGEIQNPLYISNDYTPFDYTPRRKFVGQYFNSDSQYDETLGDIQGAMQQGLTIDDLRARKQSGWDMAANALVNNLVIAGTTAISGTVGLADGIFEAITQNDISKLWDNDVTNWSVNTQDAAREAMPIYRGKEYEDKSIWGKMGTGVFWADLFQNLGFTEGMLIPGMGVSKLMQFAPKVLRGLVPSFVSSMGEGAQEAIMERNDEVDNKTRIANQRYNELAKEIESPVALDLLDRQYREEAANIKEDATNAGNFVFASNIALLTMTNTIEFGGLFSRGFNTARRIKGAVRRTGNQLERESMAMAGLRIIGKQQLNSFSEGFEEVSQAIISRTPSELEGLNRFNDSKFNPESRELASNIWAALGQSYAETMNDPNTAVEFMSGFLTGAIGVPVLRKSKFPIGIENNAILNIRDEVDQVKKRNQWIDSINQRLADDKKIKAYYEGLTRKLAIQGRANTALDNEDAFEYKTAESEGFINDAMMFDDAGQIDYLRSVINDSVDMSDEGIDAIINETSKGGEGPFMFNGNKMSRDEVRTILKNQIDLLNSKLDSYISDKQQLETQFPNMSEEGIKAALYLKQQYRDFVNRYGDISSESFDKIKQLLEELNKEEGKEHIIPQSYEQFMLMWSSLPSFRQRVFQALNNKKSELTYDQRKDVSTKLNDLSRLQETISIYKEALDDILKNPNKADSLAAESARRAQDRYKSVLINGITSMLSQAKSAKEIGSILDNVDEIHKPYIEDALNAAINGKDSELSDKVKTYKKLRDLTDSLQKGVNRILTEEPALRSSISNFINDALENGNTAEEVLDILKEHLENLKDTHKDLYTELKSIVDHAEDTVESRRASTEDDSKESEKKIKERKKEKESKEEKGSKKKKFSISDLADSEDEAAEEDRRTREDTEAGEEKGEKDKTEPSTKKSPETLEEFLEEMSTEKLKDIASGKSKIIYKDIPESKIKSLAKTILLTRETFEVKEGDEAEGGSTESIPDTKEPALRSWRATRYSFDELKERGVRSASKYVSDIADALEELGVYEFVDSGALGVLFNANPNIKIHYVVSKDRRLKDTIVLAIEVTSEVERELKANGLKTIATFTGQDGKTYQAVGSLGYDSKVPEAQKAYNNIKEKIFGYELKKAVNGKEQPEFFVSERYSNRVKHLYSGRIVKSINGSAVRQRPLQDIDIAGKNPILGIYYNSTLRVPMLSDFDEIVPLNTKNSNARNGSVWILSREADGRYYAKAVKVKRFTKEEFDLESNAKTWLVQQILDDIRILVDPEELDEDRSKAKYDLMSLIYIPKEHSILFNGDSISIKGYKNNIGKDLSVEEKAEALLEALMDKKLNFRFQVIPSKLGDPDYVSRLLEAGILTTDLAQLQNVNASFDLFIPNKKGEVEDTPVKKPKGHTGRRSKITDTTEESTITLNGETYTKVGDTIKDSEGNIVTGIGDIELIAAFSRLLNMPDYNPETFYTITLVDGTKVGIKNSHTYTGKEFEKMAKKEEEKVKEEKRDKAAREMSEKMRKEIFEDDESKEGSEKDEGLSDGAFETTEDFDLDEMIKFESDEEGDLFEPDDSWVRPDKTEEEPTPKSKKGLTIDEEFDDGAPSLSPKSADEITTIKKFAKKRAYLPQILSLGFKTVDELVKFIENNPKQFSEVVNSGEDFKKLLEKLKSCPIK